MVVSLADARGTLNMDELLAMKLNQGVRFDHLASVYEQYTGKIAVENLRPSWMIFGDGFRKRPTVAVLKRAFDVVLALVGLVLAAPVMLVVWLVLRFGSKGPVLYSQTRVGKDGHLFTCLKFRTMVPDAEARLAALQAEAGHAAGLFKMKDDPRITRSGRWLRRYSVDELPQLLNVLRGDMSLVGPRPPLPSEVETYGEDVARRLHVRPGLTGLWQVSGRSDLSWAESVRLDVRYVDNWSLRLDAQILARTARAVLGHRGAY